MLRLLGRYIFREIITSAALGTLVATFVIFLRGMNKLFELLVQSSGANVKTVASLFALAVPPVLPLTIPFGVLVGILIGLGRMAADGEIVAMRANGVSSRRVIPPVLFFAALGMCLAGYASLRLTPLASRESTRILNELAATQLSAEVPPRLFVEDFPNRILYVGDVVHGDPVQWHPLFLANVAPPEKRSTGLREKGMGPMIITAREAYVVSDPPRRRMQLSMHDAFSHEMGADGTTHDVFAPQLDMALDAGPARAQALRSSAMNTSQLFAARNPDGKPGGKPDANTAIEYGIELHRRFALPVACIMLALVGIPLGIATRKGGRSAGYVNAVFLAFFCYYLSSVSLVSLAKQGTLPVPVAIWLPDVVFGLAGIVLIARMERPGDRDPLAAMGGWFGARFQALKAWAGAKPPSPRFAGWRLPLLPQLIDTYILSQFLLYFGLLLASFVSLTLIWNFFELTGDMVRNKIPLSTMFTYLFFLTPALIYETLPISVLVGVLVAFGVLTRQNEITAFKASGVSLHRLAAPILLGGAFFSVGLFAFDFYYVPGANRKQDALRDEIKGRATQTYLAPDRKWIMGHDSRIYYYRYFDPSSEPKMLDVNIFELNPATFRMVRQVQAESARWSPSLKKWIFENGWVRDFGSGKPPFEKFQVTTFPELTEAPDYFLKEQVQDKQMNFVELDGYIKDLRQSGFDTVRLQVQFYRKFSVPLFAIIMALIAVPFGFMVGNRGAMTGIGASIVIAIAYWGISTLFEAAGNTSQLPAAMAAWSPDVAFALAGLYMVLRMRS